jgi:pyruvate/2-oxoglutarate dehydrogenase complex dihydrolipoamide acyltransferase (E2) component
MPVIAVRIPQMGEGLQEARLVAVLKQPGDEVKRDEPLYQMETDKAVMDVESPYDGKLVEWLAEVDTILPIGSPVASMDVADGVQEMAVHGAPAASAKEEAPDREPAAVGGGGARNAAIPPRTRAYAKEKGLSDDDLSQVPFASGKLMPSDIDAYLAGTPAASGAKPKTAAGGPFLDEAMNQKQRLLSSRLARGAQLVVPGTISVAANWEPVERMRQRVKASGSDFQPSSFTMFAYGVAKAMAEHPLFRSALRGDDTIRTYEQANLGIAVALPDDELVLAVVDGADRLSWREFAEKAREQIEKARQGQDQAHEAVTVSITNMQHAKLRDAVPVLVSPSVGVLFLGEVYNGLDNDVVDEIKLKRQVNLALTFDHRLINGVGAADFLNAVKSNTESISQFVEI